VTTSGATPTTAIRVAATNVSMSLGGGLVAVSGGQGALFITPAA